MINLYYHGGSENHGCEAIVRSTSKLLSTKLFLWSTAPNTDCTYGLDNVVSIQEDGSVPLAGLKLLTFKMHHKLTGSDIFYTKFSHRNFFSAVQCGDIYLSIGGDNYCYAGKDILGHYNQIIHEKGVEKGYGGQKG